MTMLIKGGTVISATGATAAEVLVDGERGGGASVAGLGHGRQRSRVS